MKTSTSTMLALAAGASAQAMGRPESESICDYYTTALLKENNATTQGTVLTLVVNTAVIGNYTMPNVGIAVPGILAPGTGEFEGVNLAPYFSGALASSNRGGSEGVSVNFLDSGAAEPLMKNMPANDMNSAQGRLLTHLYSYFASLLGCSQFGNTTSPYEGSTNMYEVHKFMALNKAEVGWFIQNVGLSAASFGVAESDVAIVGKALNDAFGMRCSAPASIPASAEAAPQAICIADDCPEAAMPQCGAYQAVVEPKNATMTGGAMGGNSSAPAPSGTSGATPSSSVQPQASAGAAAAGMAASAAAMGLGLFAFLL